MRNKEMARYDKIVLASQMFERSHETFVNAQTEMDYVTSIMLSGAVLGIVSPLLSEQGGLPEHEFMSHVYSSLYPEEKGNAGLFRATYNSLKHSGDKRRSINPSSDLEIEANLQVEAARMLEAAKSDFKEIKAASFVHTQVSEEFMQLLESEQSYA